MILRLCYYLYFSSGSEGHVACGVGILPLLLSGLTSYQDGESGGEVAT